jgi:hypothetical protein
LKLYEGETNYSTGIGARILRLKLSAGVIKQSRGDINFHFFDTLLLYIDTYLLYHFEITSLSLVLFIKECPALVVVLEEVALELLLLPLDSETTTMSILVSEAATLQDSAAATTTMQRLLEEVDLGRRLLLGSHRRLLPRSAPRLDSNRSNHLDPLHRQRLLRLLLLELPPT